MCGVRCIISSSSPPCRCSWARHAGIRRRWRWPCSCLPWRSSVPTPASERPSLRWRCPLCCFCWFATGSCGSSWPWRLARRSWRFRSSMVMRARPRRPTRRDTRSISRKRAGVSVSVCGAAACDSMRTTRSSAAGPAPSSCTIRVIATRAISTIWATMCTTTTYSIWPRGGRYCCCFCWRMPAT